MKMSVGLAQTPEPWGKDCKLCNNIYGMAGRVNISLGSADLKLEIVVPFLIVKSDLRAIIPPNIPNQNFEIAILFSVFEESGNYVFEDDNHPTALRVRFLSIIFTQQVFFAL